MAAPKSFQLAAKAQVSEKDAEYEPITLTVVDADGEKHDLVAHYPGDGAVTLLMAASSADGGAQMIVGTIFATLEQTFSAEDYRFIRQRVLSEELTIDMMMEMFQSLIEEWTSFPTQRSSDSPQSPPTTGTRSTGRSPGKGSTQRNSPPVAS